MKKIVRFKSFLEKEKTRKFFAFLSFLFYVIIISICLNFDWPFVLDVICFIFFISIGLLVFLFYYLNWIIKRFERKENHKNILQNIKTIFREVLMFIPILIIVNLISSFIMIGKPTNQTAIYEELYKAPILYSINVILIGPIMEELIFRFLPYKFIRNEKMYIIVSSVIFAALHVVNDINPFYYIWCYLPTSLWYGYRYCKTKNILATISIHSFNNLFAIVLYLLQ